MHEQGHTHSKADYYPGHLFIRVLSHTLSKDHHFKHHIYLHHHNSGEEYHVHHEHGASAKTQIPDITVTSPKNHNSRHASHPETNTGESPMSHLPRLDLEGGCGSGVHAQYTEERTSDDSIDKTRVLSSPPMTATSPEHGSDPAKSLKGKAKSKKPDVLESEQETAHPHIRKILGFLTSHLSLRKRMTALSGFGGPVSVIFMTFTE